MTTMNLRTVDRCDTRHCGAQARVRLWWFAVFLDLCAHHYLRATGSLLLSPPMHVEDNRDRICGCGRCAPVPVDRDDRKAAVTW
jgi:hypothetical protein